MTSWDIHPEAQRELEDAITHYLSIDEELAVSFDSHYEKYRSEITATPSLYSLRRGPVRRVNLTPRFGEHYIAYMIWKNKVVILAVAHAKRQPYYWRKRIGESKDMF